MKTLKLLTGTAVMAILFSSCGTICGGRITDCQKRNCGSKRQIRPAALIGDILLFPIISLSVDFIDGAIYVPCGENNSSGGGQHH